MGNTEGIRSLEPQHVQVTTDVPFSVSIPQWLQCQNNVLGFIKSSFSYKYNPNLRGVFSGPFCFSVHCNRTELRLLNLHLEICLKELWDTYQKFG